MLGYDKYLDSAFWVAGYGAVGEMAMAALSKRNKNQHHSIFKHPE